MFVQSDISNDTNFKQTEICVGIGISPSHSRGSFEALTDDAASITAADSIIDVGHILFIETIRADAGIEMEISPRGKQ